MYYIGIDGGGTKTEGVLSDSKGQVLAQKLKKGCNPNDIGVEQTAAILQDLALELCLEQGVSPSDTKIFAGVSGCGVGTLAAQVREILLPTFPNIAVASDIINVIEAGLEGKNGIVVIAGTGSSFAVNEGGRYEVIGGNGYLFEEGGSGYSIGKEGFLAALKEEDGMEAPTKITKLYQDRLGKSVKAALGEIYQGGKSFIASFSKEVFAAYEQGDLIAEDILKNSASYIVKSVRKIYEHSGVEKRVALAGGLFYNPTFAKWVIEGLDGEVSVTTKVPVYGALQMAMK